MFRIISSHRLFCLCFFIFFSLVVTGAASDNINDVETLEEIEAIEASETVEQAAPAEPVENRGETVKLEDVLNPEPSKREQACLLLVEQSIKSSDKEDGWHGLAGKKASYLSRSNAALQAIEKNLTIMVSKGSGDLAREAIGEAKAVFDPILNVSVGYNQTKTFKRKHLGTVWQKRFKPNEVTRLRDNSCLSSVLHLLEPEEYPEVCKGDNGKPQIINIGWHNFEEGHVYGEIDASRSQSLGPGLTPETYSASIGISQQLRTGGSYSLSDATTYREISYDSSGRTYGQPWSTSVVLGLNMPLPGTKDFGELNSTQYDILMKKRVPNMNYWEVKLLIDQILLAVELAYWDLASAYEQLAVAIKNRKLVEKQLAHTNHLLELRMVTEYGKMQIEAEFARTRVVEELARARVLTASVSMGKLMEVEGEGNQLVYVPLGYTEKLTDDYTVAATPLEMLENGKKYNPTIHIQKLMIENGIIVKNYKNAQARPDIYFGSSLALRQTGAKIGYEDIFESKKNIFDPDSLSQSYKLSQQYRWKNRAAKEQISQAKYGLKKTRVGLRSRENTIRNTINNSLAVIHAAMTRDKMAKQSEEFTRQAFDRLLRKRKNGTGGSELELISNMRNLVNAHLSMIAARIDKKKSESRLLAVQGIIANQYLLKTSNNKYDQYRVAKLAEKEILKYFMPITAE
jgi:outer membrane protein TolC